MSRPIFEDPEVERDFRDWQEQMARRMDAALRSEPLDGRLGSDLERRDPWLGEAS